MAGASEEALNSGREILQVMSDANKLYLVPGGVGAGSNMKMVHQVLAGIHILGASEAIGFAAQLGLDAKTTAEKIIGSEAWTWMHENRLQRMVEEDWNPGASALTIILKDVVCCLLRSVFSTNTDSLGYYHHFCPPAPLPDTSLLDCRTSLPLGAATGLRP
jgi:3-hydroxyisobutyrate dehydrogenase-like beta-hydroxyacid dehydrogenase